MVVVSKDGTQIAYDVFGNGPALIYISGAICHRKFSPIVKDAKIFAQSFRTIVYDRRGRGDSSDAPLYRIEREIEDIEALIDACGGKAFLYGHSSGAVLALETALKTPEKVPKAVLYDIPYSASEREQAEYRLLRREVETSLANGHHTAAIRQFLVGIGMPRIFTYLLPLMPGWRRMKALAPTLLYDMTLTEPLAPIARMQKIKVPFQLLYGAKSPDSILRVAEQVKPVVPPGNFIEVPGQDHMVDPKILLPYLNRFLS
ncbi:MAG: alpha/beta hydrolase [Bdellovibrionaceae bacterium]|nr:alpha/beta hydrolase [Pseudobdellovibrionaceae bacterium]